MVADVRNAPIVAEPPTIHVVTLYEMLSGHLSQIGPYQW